MAAARAAKAAKHAARTAEMGSVERRELPDLRMRITVERFDLAEANRHIFELHSTRRVDTYRVTVDGKPWRLCGLSRVLEGLRKACPRMMSPVHF
jgi:hypothetical protein